MKCRAEDDDGSSQLAKKVKDKLKTGPGKGSKGLARLVETTYIYTYIYIYIRTHFLCPSLFIA